VSGTAFLQLADGTYKDCAGVTVELLPVAPEYHDLLLKGARDSIGEFHFSQVPAGEYFVVAVPGGTVREWNDPRFLEQLMPSAARITLGDGERKSIDVKTVAVR